MDANDRRRDTGRDLGAERKVRITPLRSWYQVGDCEWYGSNYTDRKDPCTPHLFVGDWRKIARAENSERESAKVEGSCSGSAQRRTVVGG